MEKTFLPISKKDMKSRNWNQLDFIIITGDAYVDHPSFGTAIISRYLEANGFKIGIIAQPNWKTRDDFKSLGEPKYGFLISAGNVDSMVNHYSVNKKRRKKDVYSPGAKTGLRPDRASIVYTNIIKSIYKNKPVILGGLEASLRRLAHYDYWDNNVRRSILLDSKADLIVYGMGEKTVLEVCNALKSGIDIKYLNYINGTVYKTKDLDHLYNHIYLPSFKEILDSKVKFAKSFKIQYENTDHINGKILIEKYEDIYVIQNIPSEPLKQEELDMVYSLPFTKEYHPVYKKEGGVPSLNEVKFSLTQNRGCFGGCNFCAIVFHQGRQIQSRSKDSLIEEARNLLNFKDFKGYINDVGGPTANFRNPSCKNQLKKGVCKTKQCLFPSPCSQLDIDHNEYLNILRELRNIDGIKKVFVKSGIRFDYLMLDDNKKFFHELVKHHISGQLKIAPEHICNLTLNYMGKPSNNSYEKFQKEYIKLNKKYNKDQFLIPYFISSHPGSTLNSAIKLAEYIRDLGYMPEQVQDFYPTPGTISTCMYYTSINPLTGENVNVIKDIKEKQIHRAFMQFRNPKNYNLILKGLKKANRMDLVGYHKNALIRPKKNSKQ